MNEIAVLSNDLSIITAEINSYKQMAGQAIFEIGRRLKHVKENDVSHGQWEKWCKEDLGFTPQHANKFIRVTERFENRTSTFGLSLDTLNLLVGMSDEQIEQKHTVPSTGEQKAVDEMTVRELKEVKKALQQAEQDKTKLAQLLTEERNKQPEVIERVVERVVDKTDYNKINKLQNDLKDMERQIEDVISQKESTERLMKEEKKDAESYRILKGELEGLRSKRDNIVREIESASTIGKFIVRIEKALQEDLAPVKYTRAISEQINSPAVLENLSDVVSQVEQWCKEIRSLMPSENYIDAEVIPYE